MPVELPGVLVKIYVPDMGTSSQRVQQESLDNVTQITVRAWKVELLYNNHNEADETNVECAYDDAGIDPRVLRNCEVYVFMDDTSDGYFQPSADNLRFVGIAVDVKRTLRDDHVGVSIRALDYTTLFITKSHHGGFPPKGVPLYSDTLTTAWQRICDYTGWYDLSTGTIVSTVQRLKDRIVFEPPDLSSLTIGSAVSARMAKIGKLQIPKGDPDPWAVWQTAVGSLGLISFIRGDQCVVTTATDFYTAADPPRLIYGQNVHSIEETRDQQALSGKNVGIFSFNAMTGKTLEAYYPPLSDVTPAGKAKKKIGASALGPGVVVRSQDYEIFDVPMPITDQATLNRFAQRVWEERSRQELHGRLTTSFIHVYTLSQYQAGSVDPNGGGNFNLLSLQAGDRVRVEIDRTAISIIQKLPTTEARIVELQRRGYGADMAQYIVTNLQDISNLSPEFQVHSVRITLEAKEPDSCRFEIEIEYLNRILVSGSSKPGTGVATPALSSQAAPS